MVVLYKWYQSTCNARLMSQKFSSRSKKYYTSVIRFARPTVQLTVMIRPPPHFLFFFFLLTKLLKI